MAGRRGGQGGCGGRELWLARAGPAGGRVRGGVRSEGRRRRGCRRLVVHDGLHLALHLLGIGPGDEVVVPSFSFIATANCAVYVGATPVFADVEPEDGNISARTVEPVLTERTRAVIVVDQGGMPADVEPLRQLCERRGIALVEDAACAAGSRYRGAPVGAGAVLAAWSFHPRKLLTTGEGGMLTTSDARAGGPRAAAAGARDEHQRGSAPPESAAGDRELPRGRVQLPDDRHPGGRRAVQLRKLDAMVDRRRELAARYQAMLADVPGLRTVKDPAWGESNFQSFWVELDAGFPLSRNDPAVRPGPGGRVGAGRDHGRPPAARLRGPSPRRPASDRATDRPDADPSALPHHDRARAAGSGRRVIRRAAGLRAA